ncbi:MAG TPA: DUF4831 family protein [Bacteroidales bacterium]|nr:DUF4831 family protein [Bacteroidales bacterium]HQJ82027.1 DUF4831 family protein [Bacteroidales bacterium]
MKKTGLLLTYLMIILLAGSCSLFRNTSKSYTRVTPLSDTTVLREGSLIYALPRTMFTIKVELERTIELPGPYAGYADELLGLRNVILHENENWMIRSVSVSSHEEADPSEFYVIESNTQMQSNYLALRKEGLIFDLYPRTSARLIDESDGKEIDVSRFRSFDLGSDEYYRVQTDTVYKRVSVDEQFIRIPYIVEKRKKLSDAQLAEKAARRLMDLRDGKFMILMGEANVFPQSTAAIDEINRMERELTELFTGKTITDIRTFTYSLVPEKRMEGAEVGIFRFSELTGPEAVDSESGMPVVIEMVPERKTKDIAVISRGPADSSPSGPSRVYYRIPDIVNVKIRLGDETLYNSRKLVYQFGTVMQLPANYIIGR